MTLKYCDTIDFMERVDAALLKVAPWIKPTDYTVVGGALRDTLLGVPVKDIDVVVRSTGDWNIPWDTASGLDYGPTGAYTLCDPGWVVDGLPIQMIYRDGDVSIPSMVKYHSLAISNVFWHDGKLVLDHSFVRDALDKQHTVNTPRWADVQTGRGAEMLQKYVDKIQAKYPWPIRELDR
jgi:hypothetical protein